MIFFIEVEKNENKWEASHRLISKYIIKLYESKQHGTDT